MENEITTYFNFEFGVNAKFWPDTYYIIIKEQKNDKVLAINEFTVPNDKDIFQYETTMFWGPVTYDQGGSYSQESDFGKPRYFDFNFERTIPEKAASEDLIPNPVLESLMSENLSTDDVSIELSVNPYLSIDENTGRTKFRITGKGFAPEKENFIIELYSNEYTEYLANKPLTSDDIFLMRESEDINEFIFHPNYKGKFKPGLYYVVIKSKEENKVWAVDNFEILTKEPFQVEEYDSLVFELNQFNKYDKFLAENLPGNFRPNLELEKYIDSTIVVDEVEMNLLVDELVSKDNKGIDHIKMRITAKANPSSFTFLNRKLKIYSNNQSDFKKDLPLYSTYVGFPYWQKNDYGIDAKITGLFRPGLYYVLFTGPDGMDNKEVILAAKKFVVE